MSKELTFDMLRIRKPKRGNCMRCFTNPSEGLLLIQAFDIPNQASGALVSLTTTLCLDCIEIMYRAIAAELAQAITFGKKCAVCHKDKTINGRITLIARKYTDTGKQPNGSRRSTVIANGSFTYCESCTVRMYHKACSIRDASLAEGMPSQEITS